MIQGKLNMNAFSWAPVARTYNPSYSRKRAGGSQFEPSTNYFPCLSSRILPERFLAILKQKINIKFDAVIGYKVKE
jgi:hypothetical protein